MIRRRGGGRNGPRDSRKLSDHHDVDFAKPNIRQESLELRPLGVFGRASVVVSARCSPHPKIRRLRQEAAEAAVDLRKAKNARLPQLDLSLQYTSVGLGTHNSAAYDQMDSFKFPGWLVMLNFSMPLSNFTTKGDVQRQIAAVAGKTLAAAKGIETLSGGMSSYGTRRNSSIQQLASLRERLRAAEQILQMKERAFAAGHLTFFEFHRAQDEFFTLKAQESQILTEGLKSVSELYAAKGRLFTDVQRAFFVRHRVE